MTHWSIVAVILFPFIAAIGGILLTRGKEKPYYIIAVTATAVEFLLTLVLALVPADATVWLIGGAVGHGLGFTVDGFRRVYGVIISFMWWMTMLLSRDYFAHHHKLSRYFFFNLMTLGAIEGVFLARDLFTALVFFEIMSFTSFPWVIQEETEEAKDAANIYLAIAVIGGMVSLMGLFLLDTALGTLVVDELYEKPPPMRIKPCFISPEAVSSSALAPRPACSRCTYGCPRPTRWPRRRRRRC